MKKMILPLMACLVAIASCKKEDNNSSNNNDPQPKDGFVWKEDGGAEITADSAYWTTWGNGTGVRAYKNGMANYFEINWDGAGNTAANTYTLQANGGITFLKGNDTYVNPSDANITITGFSNDKLSGNFNISVSGGSIQKVSATFTNIPKK